jgi:hypothetical protein
MTRALNGWRMVLSYSVTVISVSWASFYQHLFDVVPLLEQELLWELVGVIRECNLIGKMLDSAANPD